VKPDREVEGRLDGHADELPAVGLEHREHGRQIVGQTALREKLI